eukprot:844955_1
MCLCTTPYASCKPTQRALRLGRLLYFIMFILLGVLICGFFGGYSQLSILAIFLIITGWCGVRKSNIYNIEQILCVTFFSGYIWVYTLVDLILKIIADQMNLSIPTLISLFGGVVFYLATCIVAKLLYDELRTNYQSVDDIALQQNFAYRLMGGQNTQNQAQQIPQQETYINNDRHGRGTDLGGGNRNTQTSGFRAFSGQAHSLVDP